MTHNPPDNPFDDFDTFSVASENPSALKKRLAREERAGLPQWSLYGAVKQCRLPRYSSACGTALAQMGFVKVLSQLGYW